VRVTLDGNPCRRRAAQRDPTRQSGTTHARSARNRATFATLAFGRIQGLSVLDLSGIPRSDRPRQVLSTGALGDQFLPGDGQLRRARPHEHRARPTGRERQLTLAPPISRSTSATQGVAFTTNRNNARCSGGWRERSRRAPCRGARAQTARCCGLGRYGAPPEVGPEPIAWLENKVFGAKDSLKRASLRALHAKAASPLKAPPEQVVAKVLDGSDFAHAADSWPPPSVPSIWKDPKPGEGEWTPSHTASEADACGLPADAKAARHTSIAPDPTRSGAAPIRSWCW